VYNITIIYTMRTNIDIDDKLMASALKATRCTTKREVVEKGLRILVRIEQQKKLLKYEGKLLWEGDLDAMRTDK
jgi:Arc/MetJ family transcription regulator